ncbi:UNVERIFIED_CONTAM: hypothetical protein N8J90_17375 [Halobacillus marinus]
MGEFDKGVTQFFHLLDTFTEANMIKCRKEMKNGIRTRSSQQACGAFYISKYSNL